jgi:hypothetical protein
MAMVQDEQDHDADIIFNIVTKLEKLGMKIDKELTKYKRNKILPPDVNLKELLYTCIPDDGYLLPSIAVDIYTILRMFKNFELDTDIKRNRGPLWRRGKQQNKIIVYSGAYKCVISKLFPHALQFTADRIDRNKVVHIGNDKVKTFDNFNEIIIFKKKYNSILNDSN